MKDKRFIVVKLLNETPDIREGLCEELVANLEDVDLAYPAYDDGFGRFVKDGREVKHQEIDGL